MSGLGVVCIERRPENRYCAMDVLLSMLYTDSADVRGYRAQKLCRGAGRELEKSPPNQEKDAMVEQQQPRGTQRRALNDRKVP